MSEKSHLRQQLIKTRSQLNCDELENKNTQICQLIQTTNIFIKAKTILAYFSIKKEPNLAKLFTGNQTNSPKIWGFPRCVGGQGSNHDKYNQHDKNMTWHQWQPHQPLITGRYGIQEPPPEAVIITPNQVDLILVPCVACDRHGYRLGYGGGYYDRMFSDPQWQNIHTIGITFDFALIDQLPTEPWDCKLNYICTEDQLLTVSC